jgi:ribulose-5-phosphate 4-epimerase/fuculose-1-phosphate aldolase
MSLLKPRNEPFETPSLEQKPKSIAAERLDRKQKLAAAFRLFARFGFDEGVAGHITARDPEETECFWVNPFGLYFGHIRASDLILVDAQGNVVQGRAKVNRAAFAIHSRVHHARPDVIAAAHSHSMYGRTFSTLGKKLDAITQDACAFYDDHGIFEDYNGVVLDTSEGDRIAAALGHRKAVILRNHGLLTVGHTVESAAFWFISMDRCCHTQLMAEAAGKPITIAHDEAIKTRGQVGSEPGGWFSFQPLFNRIVQEEPDLLE